MLVKAVRQLMTKADRFLLLHSNKNEVAILSAL